MYFDIDAVFFVPVFIFSTERRQKSYKKPNKKKGYLDPVANSVKWAKYFGSRSFQLHEGNDTLKEVALAEPNVEWAI